MSVPTWRRNLSRTEYLYQLYQLNIKVGEIVRNTSKKYRDNYGDILIKTAYKAMEQAEIANGMPVDQEEELFIKRKELLHETRGYVNSISRVAYIFLESVRKGMDENDKKYPKLYDWENEIGEMCSTINKLIAGVRKSDKERRRRAISGD